MQRHRLLWKWQAWEAWGGGLLRGPCGAALHSAWGGFLEGPPYLLFFQIRNIF